MKKTFYEKVGRRYKPVYQYDQTLTDAFPKGSHLVICYPGGYSRRYNIDPNYAAMIAAGRVAEDAISTALMEATEIRRTQRGTNDKTTPLTSEQKAAWEHLVKVFGPEARQLEYPCARECAEKAVQAMYGEAMQLMQHESVRQAYEHFQLMCELAKDHNAETR